MRYVIDHICQLVGFLAHVATVCDRASASIQHFIAYRELLFGR